jgi:hypothetical protein
MSLTLARLTVSGDKKAASERVSRLRGIGGELEPSAMSHMFRVLAALGQFDEAETWLNQLSFSAAKSGDEGLLFVSEISRVMLEFDRTRSHNLLGAIELLRNRPLAPLQEYTLDVAELHMLSALDERERISEALDRCKHHEAIYGVGSPLAARIRSRISARSDFERAG